MGARLIRVEHHDVIKFVPFRALLESGAATPWARTT
jgi:hypothetical protein